MALIGDEALKIFEYFDIPTENSNFDLTISKFDFYILCKKIEFNIWKIFI